MNRFFTLSFSKLEPERGLLRTIVIRSLSLLLAAAAPFSMMNAYAASAEADEAQCFARNLYFEARSEGPEGMVAVGWVVLNRVNSTMYPDSICAVIYEGGERPPCEFNWWCDGRSDRPNEPASWELAQQVTDQMLNNPPADPTDGALWFHMDSIPVPVWLRSRQRTLHLGDHYFYK